MAEDLMDKVFSFFQSDDNSDDKQNMLKQIAKELGQNKYARFFKVRTEETDPSFMSFLFSVYKTIFPIRVFMHDEKKMARLRQMTIESSLDHNILETINRLETASLDIKAKTMQGDALIASIQGDIDILVTQFDSSKIAAANHKYEMAAYLAQFVRFKFPVFFKRFDPHFADGSFLIEPKFPPIKTILIINEMEEFLAVTQQLRPEDDWNGLLNILRTIEGQDLVIPEQFTTMIKTLREIHTTKILEYMVQYTIKNPVWQWKHTALHETIGEEWLESKKAEAKGYIAKINNVRKSGQINAMTKQIFEASDLVRLENYTVHLSETYHKRKLEYFVYAEGVNFLKAFLDDYVEKEIKELCDILLIRGQWTNNTMSREMSAALHQLEESHEPIATLDTVLGEDGADGSRLRASMLRLDRDPTQARYINSIIAKNNEDALEIINLAAQSLIVIGKHLKNLIEDVQKKHPELLVNWRELNLASKEPIAQRMIDDFKKINYFIQLMHLCTQ